MFFSFCFHRKNKSAYLSEGWSRPSDWLALPAVVATDQVFHGLHAVFDHGSNFATVTATGNYVVDWGDGSTPVSMSSGTTAYHNFVYADIPINSECSRGYRQAIVTITPQSGQTLSNIVLSVKHNQSGLPSPAKTGWLDVRMALNNVGTVTLYNANWGHSLLEQFEWIGTNSQTNFSDMFYSCYSLQSIPLLNTAAGTSFSSMFGTCYSLQSIPLLNTAAGTNFSDMFYSCYSLQSIPLLNTAAGTNFSSMFYRCYSLQSIPLLNTAAGTSFSSMFGTCYSLQSIPLLNTAAGTNFSSMFYSCYSLQSIPLLNTAAGTSFSDMFYSCYSLQSIPLLNTAAGTSFSNMFYSCYSLQSIPLLNTAAGTSFSNMFYSCYSLSKSQITGAQYTHSYQNCRLSPAALNEIYTNLPTVSGQTITVTGNWGTTGDDPAIATAKGWTVTG